MIRTTCCSLFAFAGIALAQAPTAIAPLRPQPTDSVGPVVAAMQSSRAIDLVICLDVSGSMSGLINAARQNLWSIVNDMATLQPQPELRVALLTYGSPVYGADTGFVSIQTELTTDLDLVSQKLFALKTNGGKEYVARVVKRSLDDLKWSSDSHALKLIFVCGNEAATQDPEFNAMQMASTAIGKGVLVNTIYCGSQQKPEADGWRQVARMADGKFAAIEHNQVVVIETPFDKQLLDLSAQLNKTYLTFGRNGLRWSQNQIAQDRNALSLNSAVAAERCVTKGSSLYYNPTFDLCDAIKNPEFKLASVKKELLPKDLQVLTIVQLKAHVELTSKKRQGIQKKVAEMGRKRDAYVLAERKKKAGAGEKMFEEAILETVRAQAASRGFTRRPQPKLETPKLETPIVKPPVAPIAVPQGRQPQPVLRSQVVPQTTPAKQQQKAPKQKAPKQKAKGKDLMPTAMQMRFQKVLEHAAKEYQGNDRRFGLQ